MLNFIAASTRIIKRKNFKFNFNKFSLDCIEYSPLYQLKPVHSTPYIRQKQFPINPLEKPNTISPQNIQLLKGKEKVSR